MNMTSENRRKRIFPRKFCLFERSAGGMLNLRFDSKILESSYTECSYPRVKGRFRFVSLYGIFGCIIWMIYFCIFHLQPGSMYLVGFALGAIVSLLAFALTFSNNLFKKYYIQVCGFYVFLCSLLALLTFVPPIPQVSLAFNLSLVMHLILLFYAMIPLRLWQQITICSILSLVHVILASVRYGWVGVPSMFVQICAHISVHAAGIILHLMSQVWRRSTFLRLGYSALMRNTLKKEQELRDDMIRSLMPSQVAQEVMRDVGNETGDETQDGKGKEGETKTGLCAKCMGKQGGEKGRKAGDSLDEESGNQCSGTFENVDKDAAPDTNGNPADANDCATSLRELEVIPSAHGLKTNATHRAVTFRKFHVSQLENVSVLFADIVGFTKMSSNKTASRLVYLLNDLFGRFDRLCEHIGCEKIATLGDCYYCVSGCPNPVENHAELAVEMGRAMCLAIQQFDEDHNEEVNMRVGVHTGKVICGIVGTRRFKFDVWSNDVTLANEMESSGQAGKVHISEATLSFVKDIYEVSDGEPVQDIRKFKVLIEFFNKEEQCFAIKHTQDEAMIKTYFIEKRFDGKPVVSLRELDGALAADGTGDAQAAEDGKVAEALAEHDQLTDERNKLCPVPKNSDEEMLQALQDFVSVDEVFSFPPISHWTLNFHNPSVERSYRRLGLRRPDERATKRFSCSPRVELLFNAVVCTVIFVLVFITCVVAFHDYRGNVTHALFSILTLFAMVLHAALLTVLFLDLATWSCKASPNRGWRRFVLRFYTKCFRWHARNLIGVLVLVMPASLVLSNFSTVYFTDPVPGVLWAPYAYYRLVMGLFLTFMLICFTLFTPFSSWSKTVSASCVCVLSIVLLLVSAGMSEDLLYVTRTNSNQTIAERSLWMLPVLERGYRWELCVILILTLVLLGTLNREFDVSLRLSFHREHETVLARRAIAHQKLQAEWLLENIIPSYIIQDLRQTSKYSQHIEDAGVVFACISNFAEFYDEQYQGGQEMLRVLNEIFADFEHQLSLVKYKDVEKIKTIGACFMAASGLNMVERNRNTLPDAHLWALMDFALDLIHTLDDFNRQMFNFQFEMKVGYNVGEVTAGVIGTTKLLYDIWGDTVNVASRMYSTGQKGRIQVTEAIAKRLESRYVFEYRGEVFVKGKGNMRTYLLCHRRTD